MFKLSNLLRHLLRYLGPDIITLEHYLSGSIISMQIYLVSTKGFKETYRKITPQEYAQRFLGRKSI